MNAKEKTKRHFDETAADYNNSSDGKFVEPMYKALVEKIKNSGKTKLLDIGCGNGNLFGLISNCGLTLCGIDLSDKMIDQAKARYESSASFCVADAEKLPFNDNSFDILVCNASFHHYTNPNAVLDEMRRVAKKDCLLLLGDPYAPQPIRFIANIFTKYSNEGDYHYYGIKEMKNLFAAHGFQMTDAQRTGDHSILFVAEKC